MVRIAIVGAGWRSAFHLRALMAVRDRLEVCAVIARNPLSADRIRQMWNVPVFPVIDDLRGARPDFVLVSVLGDSMPRLIEQVVGMGYPVLAETWWPERIEDIGELYRRVGDKSMVQAAEQYPAQPHHSARLALIRSGALGRITQARVSAGHGYHGVALIRAYLDAGFRPCSIAARRFETELIKGPGHDGWPATETTFTDIVDMATLKYADRFGVFDFSDEQYFSPYRSMHTLIRGTRGEIADQSVCRLVEYPDYVREELTSIQGGVGGELDGPGTLGIVCGGQWLYRNPFPQSRLSEEETAVALRILGMANYVSGGRPPYPFEEACQDQYLAMLINQAISTGECQTTTEQPWMK